MPATFVAVTVTLPPEIRLTDGTEYVLYLTTDAIPNTGSNSTCWGVVTGGDPYPYGTANYNNIAATAISNVIAKATASVVVTPYNLTYDGTPHSAVVTSVTGLTQLALDLHAELLAEPLADLALESSSLHSL